MNSMTYFNSDLHKQNITMACNTLIKHSSLIQIYVIVLHNQSTILLEIESTIIKHRIGYHGGYMMMLRSSSGISKSFNKLKSASFSLLRDKRNIMFYLLSSLFSSRTASNSAPLPSSKWRCSPHIMLYKDLGGYRCPSSWQISWTNFVSQNPRTRPSCSQY